MDGVLTASGVAWENLFRRFLRAQGADLSVEDAKILLGCSSDQEDELFSSILSQPKEQVARAKQDFIKKHPLSYADLRMPGVKEALTRAKDLGYKLAVATSADRKTLETMLGQTDLAELFDATVSANEVENTKPDPEVFAKAARSIGCAPSEALAIDDSYYGVCAALAAGIKTLQFSHLGSEPLNPNIEKLVTTHQEIIDFAEELNAR